MYPANDSSLVNQIGEILGTDLDTIMSLNNLDGEYGSTLSTGRSPSAVASVLPTRAGARSPSGPVRQLQANRDIPWPSVPFEQQWHGALAESLLKWVTCETRSMCPFNNKLCNSTLLITEHQPAGTSLYRSSP